MKIQHIVYSALLITLLSACGRESQNTQSTPNTPHQDNNQVEDSIVYENADGGISGEWVTTAGPFEVQEVNGAIKLTTNWISQELNEAEYQLSMYNDWYHTLEVDIGGVGKAGGHVGGLHTNSAAGEMPHFSIGVYVSTEYGDRMMLWDSYFNHEKYTAFKIESDEIVSLNYPSPVEHVRGFDYEDDLNKWEHFKVNLNDYLNKLEPGNKLLSVEKFFATGGYLDNIKLTNN